MKEKKNLLFPIVLMKGIIGGIFGSLQHVLILSIADSFGLSTGELGGLLGANYVASVVMPLIAGRLGDLFGKKRVVIASIIVSIIGSLVVIFSKTAMMYSVGIIIAGFGGNAESSVITPALADTYPKKATQYITLLQVSGSLSGIISPMIVSALNVRLGLGWREQKALALVTMLIPYISLFFIKLGTRGEGKTARGFKEVVKLLSEPSLVWGAFALLFYCATDNTYTNFLSIFYEQKFSSAEAGTIALTLNSAMYALIRFLVSFYKKDTKWLGVTSLGLSALSLVLLVTAKDATSAVIYGTCYSICFAPAYPFIISNAAVSNPGNSATATSLMFAASGLGCMLITLVSSKIAGNMGIDALYILLAVTSVISAVLYFVYADAIRKKKETLDLE